MSTVFLKILNMSISASYMILAVLLVRILLKKAPKWIRILLWGIVALRLICPVSFESIFSLIPSAEPVSPQIMTAAKPEIHTGISFVNYAVNPVISQSFAPEPAASVNPLQIWTAVAAVVWLAGMLAMLIYMAVSYFLVHRKARTAVKYRDNIFQSENVDSPFVLGLFRPKIYLPFAIGEGELSYVVAHEQTHIRRKDHLWKPFGFLLLTVYWFNPLLWLAYILLCRDIEFACDEKVIKEMDSTSKADYSQALVSCSVHRRRIAACPLAFGEVGVKERVKSVMNYKKPAFWIIIIALISCIVVAVCFLTDPKTDEEATESENTPSAGSQYSEGLNTNITGPYVRPFTYAVEEVIYESGIYSFAIIAGENSPIYAITEAMELVEQTEEENDSGWTNLGQLQEIQLTKENFDDRFLMPIKWAGGHDAESIRESTEKAWHLTYNSEITYTLLLQKNGSVYLAYGYHNETSSSIRWLFKLVPHLAEKGGVVIRSGDRAVPARKVPYQMNVEAYADSVFWITIDPSNEYYPFTVWDGEEEEHGYYMVFDAETYEELEVFHPSGASPEGYVFENTDPTRAYIVVMILQCWEDAVATTYAFGARFPSTQVSVNAPDLQNSADYAIAQAITQRHKSEDPDGLISTASHITLAHETVSGTPSVGQTDSVRREIFYIYYLHMRFSVHESRLEEHEGIYGAAILVFTVDPNEGYVLERFLDPKSSADYDESLIKRFLEVSETLSEKHEEYSVQLLDNCWKTATDYLEGRNEYSSAITETPNYSPLIDRISYDIDRDGVVEKCTMTYGPTSGLFSFWFRVIESENKGSYMIEHEACYTLRGAYQLSFEITGDNKLRIKGTSMNESEGVVYIDIAMENDRVVLYCENENLLHSMNF